MASPMVLMNPAKERVSLPEKASGNKDNVEGGGEPLVLEGESAKKPQETSPPEDQRRNLYVLGIPHHMTLDELRELFGRYGTVQHAVILAVLDAFRRRRGFIVMNSNTEAAAAMKAMSGSVVLGHKFHVSWAVVQRSNGFLDGVDRSPGVSSLGGSMSSQWSPPSNAGPTSSASRPDRPLQIKIPPAISCPVPDSNTSQHYSHSKSLILRNLHREIFRNATDVLPLLEPFGVIQRIRLIIPPAMSSTPKADHKECTMPPATQKTQALPSPMTPTEERSHTASPALGALTSSPSQNHLHVSAIVEFTNPLDVPVAISALDGQLYGDIAIRAERTSQRVSMSPRAEFDEAGLCVSQSTADDIDHAHRPRIPPKIGTSSCPSAPNSPGFNTYSSPYLGSPTMLGFSGGFPFPLSPWMSPYSASAPPSPAQLAQFYYAQDGHPDTYAAAASRFQTYRYPYSADFPHFQEHRPVFPRTYSQQF